MSEFISVVGRTRLERVAEWLEQGAPHVTLDDKGEAVVLDGFNMEVGVGSDSCGTVCCIAGAVCQFEQPFSKEAIEWGVGFWGTNGVQTRAIELLGISEEDAEQMFTPDDDAMYGATPDEGARVIRHYLATGEVMWPLIVEEREAAKRQAPMFDF